MLVKNILLTSIATITLLTVSVPAYAAIQNGSDMMTQVTPVMKQLPSGTMPGDQDTNAGMMGSDSAMQVTPSMSMQDQQDIAEGNTLLNQFKNGQLTCQTLQDKDLEKIGEYVMNKQMGPAMHTQTNQMIVQMMGNNGEEQMHIMIGRNATACPAITPTQQPKPVSSSTSVSGMSGINSMLGWIVAGILLLLDVIFLVSKLFHKNKKNESHETPSSPAPVSPSANSTPYTPQSASTESASNAAASPTHIITASHSDSSPTNISTPSHTEASSTVTSPATPLPNPPTNQG